MDDEAGQTENLHGHFLHLICFRAREYFRLAFNSRSSSEAIFSSDSMKLTSKEMMQMWRTCRGFPRTGSALLCQDAVCVGQDSRHAPTIS